MPIEPITFNENTIEAPSFKPGTGFDDSSMGIVTNRNDGNGGFLFLGKSNDEGDYCLLWKQKYFFLIFYFSLFYIHKT